MKNLEIIWNKSSYQVEDKNGETLWRREWKIPTDYLTPFFIFWKEYKYKMRDNGFSVSKINNDWFLYETKKSNNDFCDCNKLNNNPASSTPVIENDGDDFWVPPYKVKNESGLRPWQIESTSKLVTVINTINSAMDGSEMGTGKCHPKGTLIRMFNGSLKKVEEIIIGDQLMGDNSTPRNVLSTTNSNGDLYIIHPNSGGEPFGVNGDHLLVLINTLTKEVKEISVRNYIFGCTKSIRFHNEWKLFRTGVEYKNVSIPLDPYFLGLWLGDGTWCNTQITVADIDTEIQEFLNNFSVKIGARLVIGNPKKNLDGTISKCRPYILRGCIHGSNPLLTLMRSMGILVKEKFIPEIYLHNNRQIRLEILAGLIDSDGSSYNQNGCYEISCKHDGFNDQIVELARSLGYYVNSRKIDRTWTYKGKKNTNKYWRISISGANDIPCKLKRKFSKPRLNPKNVRHTSFGVEPIGIGEYYGFTLDDNGRYLMKDFTVTHNTFTACGVARELNIPFVVICPKPVRSQWDNVIRNHFNIHHNLIEIINYEMLVKGKKESKIASYILNKKTHREKLKFKLPKNSLLIFDEAHKLKNPKTKASKTAMMAFKEGYKMLFLSASIATTPLELKTIGQCLKMFDGNKEYYEWLYNHGVSKGRWGLEFDNDKESLNRIHKTLFKDKGIRIRRDVIPNFPECEIIAEAYDMDEESVSKINSIYAEMKIELQKIKDKIKEDENELVIRLRARQATEILKVPLIIELIEEGIDAGMSVVVFLNYSDTIDAIASKFNTTCIFDGRLNDKIRNENKEKFQRNEEKLILINCSAGGLGLSMGDVDGKHPRLAIISPDDSAQKIKQVTGRIWRENSKSKSLEKLFFVKGTVEEDVMKNVQQKLDNLDILNDGDVKI